MPRDPAYKVLADFDQAFRDNITFCRESLEIRDKGGRTFTYEQGPAQRRLTELIAQIRAAGKPVRIVVLKARQVWISTGVAGHFFHDTVFTAGQKALVVAHDTQSAKEIFGYYTQFQESYKPFRGVLDLPRLKSATKKELEYRNGSYIKIATANNVKSGRAHSLRRLHLSEFAFYRDPTTLMTGLMQSVPDDADTAVIVESSANGMGGDFYKLCRDAMDPTSRSAWTFFFFAWWEHPEYQMMPDDPASFQRSLSKDEQQLRDRYNLTLGQLNWRRWAIQNKCFGSIDTFHQEYPSNPEEAFLSSGRPRFSEVALARMPIIHDALVGELEEWQQGPRTTINFVPKERGALVVYKKPAQGKQYSIGVDVAEGIDAGEGVLGKQDTDYSVACVVDRSTGEQVAKLRGRIEPAAFAEYVFALMRWYHWAFCVPESNGPGIAFIEQLLRSNCSPGLIYHRQPQADEVFANAGGTLNKLGWRTTGVTREQLISKLDSAIREFSLIIRDAHTLQEHRSFVYWPNGRAAARQGEHDDEVFAAALAVVGIEAASAAPIGNLKRDGSKQTPAGVRSYARGQSSRQRGELVRM